MLSDFAAPGQNRWPHHPLPCSIGLREEIAHLAIHFDVDVLDPAKFGAVLFNKPDAPPNAWADVPRGRMSPGQVVRLLQDVAAGCDVVGLAVAEYMPWQAIAMREMLRKLPLLGAGPVGFPR